LRSALREANPQMKLSLAPSPWPWGRDSYLQDWPAWVARGLCDELIVQLYRREPQGYERLLKATLAQFNGARPEGAPPVFAAGMLRSLGAQVVVDAATQAEMLAANARLGVASHVWFHSTGTALF
jgi:uncharacterized lipoprotein YddW (UPF0748 family)